MRCLAITFPSLTFEDFTLLFCPMLRLQCPHQCFPNVLAPKKVIFCWKPWSDRGANRTWMCCLLQTVFIWFGLLLHQSQAALRAWLFVWEACGDSLQTIINCPPKPREHSQSQAEPPPPRCKNNSRSHERCKWAEEESCTQVWPGGSEKHHMSSPASTD